MQPILASALALVIVTGCGGVSPGQGSRSRLVMWAHHGQAAEDAVLRDAVASFNLSQSDVEVTLTLLPEASYTKTLSTTDASKWPDVVEFDGPTIARFGIDGKLAPISQYVSFRTLVNATDAIKIQGMVGGDLYGLGMYDSGLGIYGNKKLLDAAGVKYPSGLANAWTAEQFTAALKKLSAKDPDGRTLDIQTKDGLATEWGTYGFSPIVSSAGGALLRNGKAAGALDTSAVAAALRTFQSWQPYIDPDPDGTAFTTGRVALSWAGHWKYPAYSRAVGSDLVVLPLPDFGHGPKTGQGSWAWGIGAHTGNGKAAGALLDYLLNDTNVRAMSDANGAPPATKTVLAASPLYRPGGPLQLFADQLAKPCHNDLTRSCVAVTRPVTTGYATLTTAFSHALNSIYTGTDPSAALAEAAQAIDHHTVDGADSSDSP